MEDWNNIGRAIIDASEKVPGVEITLAKSDDGWEVRLRVPVGSLYQMSELWSPLPLEDVADAIQCIARDIVFTAASRHDAKGE